MHATHLLMFGSFSIPSPQHKNKIGKVGNYSEKMNISVPKFDDLFSCTEIFTSNPIWVGKSAQKFYIKLQITH